MRRLLLSVTCALTLAGCSQKTTASVATNPTLARLIEPQTKPVADTFCTWAKPIYWSKNDTPETVEQIKLGHNVPYKQLCMDAEPPH